ncbi:MAG: YdcF family protein [Pirellulaceae bacterium]
MGRRRRDPRDEYADYYDESVREPARRKRVPGTRLSLPPAALHLFVLLVVGALLLGFLRLVTDQLMFEKTLQALVAPVGLVWLGLFLIAYFSLLRKQGLVALLAVGCWLLLTLAGNSLVQNWLAASLQKSYMDFDIQQMERYDVVLVLGGGMVTAPSGKAQLGSAGDRARIAAQLLLLDKAERVICSGISGLPLAEDELTQADAMEQWLLSLGIPENRILKIGGHNTFEEIQAFDKWLTQNNGGQLSKGILTSAWHLPRAIRLAEAVGVEAQPVPADFVNTRFHQTPYLLIPGSHNLERVTAFAKEYLASIFGR